ncbi:MAG: glycosyltransferase, partial [Planctomycetes bacterium]|nr:glycosyltransferase [Planctomycetota bacterium]
PPARSSARDGGGRLQVVLPVAPDLSHTFIYREAVRMVRTDGNADLVVLERGLPDAPRHAESDAVAALGATVPRPGIVRRYVQVMRWLLLHPRRASRLLRMYRDDAGGIAGLFGKLPCREPRHPGNAFALASWLATRPPGPIHVYGSTYSANVVMGAAVLLDRPYSITSYVDFEFEYDHRMLRAKYDTSRFFRVCTAFCGERVRALVPGSVAERIPVILFGLDLDDWNDRAEPAGRGVLFSASRLVPKKGLHLLPPAIAALRDRGIDCEWRLAGDGPERVRLETLVAEHGIGDRVTFLGPITTADVHAELRRADLAVMPCIVAPDGERDGIPIFFTEAMALGVPVLTTPISGIPEIIEDGVSGFLVQPGDAVALAERLAEVLCDGDARAAVGARGREVVHETLDLDDAVRELLALVRAP